MKRGAIFLTAVLLAVFAAASGSAETTLEKINRTGALVVGTRTGSPPFGFYNRQNEWVGFSIDLARLIHQKVEQKLGKPVKFELKETVPATRIPLLSSGAVDLIAGTMTITRARRESVDFSTPFFVTGAQLLVKKDSRIRSLKDLAGKRLGAQQGSTNERIVREKWPKIRLVVFQDQPAAFTALSQGKIDAYTNDGVQLAGLKAKAPNPGNYQVVGDFFSYEPYGMAMRRDDPDFRLLVDVALMEAIEEGEYFRLYEKWFGPKGEVPYPLSPEVRVFLKYLVLPR
ncbi:MAG: ABC transporter substrate-binding protein [Candidatus Tectomicrobia bacterium]|uniref:ABC transporter substrate-binding protein n=1 Tax=Tectimicrobiota bacterium TaxID=2528274 RepID=A0A932GNF5_UNCTE|nr:ABC transporter substrate-binding protein [Candidatus Tectomicrobia bacterium]